MRPQADLLSLGMDLLSKDASMRPIWTLEQELTEDDNVTRLLQSGASLFHLCGKSEAL